MDGSHRPPQQGSSRTRLVVTSGTYKGPQQLSVGCMAPAGREQSQSMVTSNVQPMSQVPR